MGCWMWSNAKYTTLNVTIFLSNLEYVKLQQQQQQHGTGTMSFSSWHLLCEIETCLWQKVITHCPRVPQFHESGRVDPVTLGVLRAIGGARGRAVYDSQL
ncbi:hypothetical protein M0802_013567 [Mischocyttarus mexicanus]|nr:hypothetical protein M0802_013567 [Mischocyttarus mexicanus]